MDDMVLFSDGPAALEQALLSVERYADEKLSLSLKPPILGAVRGGLPFLGFVLYPTAARLSRRKKGRARRRVAEAYGNLASGRWSEGTFADHVLPVFAHLGLARSLRFRQELASRWDHGIGLQPR